MHLRVPGTLRSWYSGKRASQENPRQRSRERMGPKFCGTWKAITQASAFTLKKGEHLQGLRTCSDLLINLRAHSEGRWMIVETDAIVITQAKEKCGLDLRHSSGGHEKRLDSGLLKFKFEKKEVLDIGALFKTAVSHCLRKAYRIEFLKICSHSLSREVDVPRQGNFIAAESSLF